MNIALKFNLALLAACAAGLAATAAVSERVLQQSARAEALQTARLMLESAMATRAYTNDRLVKLLQSQMAHAFLPESVPSFAAVEVLDLVRQQIPDYQYREAMLNPTNPRDRVVEWEGDVVQQFRTDEERKEIVGERDTPTGRMLYLARPIRITDPACLACHSTPQAAPRTLVQRYGPGNGFGWQLGEAVGAQIVSVPTAVHIEHARQAQRSVMTAVALVFAGTFVVINAMLTFVVVRPLRRLSALAENVSLGATAHAELPQGDGDEIGALGRAFARMDTSLRSAMAMIPGGGAGGHADA